MLSGPIPISLENQHFREFNVSFEIPPGGPFKNFTAESFMSNKGLCGDGRYGRKEKAPSSSDLGPNVAPLRVSYQELHEATDGYSNTRLLGSGSFRSVYKGTLRNGNIVSVKVLHPQYTEGAFKSFEVEWVVLRNIRRTSLFKVIGSYSNEDFKALILEYMPNGSL
ncbi:UNVERIFIED_CONTAM: putative LRR receptor-like serine/threonine-protein kinase [Sesamum indicum]